MLWFAIQSGSPKCLQQPAWNISLKIMILLAFKTLPKGKLISPNKKSMKLGQDNNNSPGFFFSKYDMGLPWFFWLVGLSWSFLWSVRFIPPMSWSEMTGGGCTTRKRHTTGAWGSRSKRSTQFGQGGWVEYVLLEEVYVFFFKRKICFFLKRGISTWPEKKWLTRFYERYLLDEKMERVLRGNSERTANMYVNFNLDRNTVIIWMRVDEGKIGTSFFLVGGKVFAD